jgi:hypothetical protein
MSRDGYRPGCDVGIGIGRGRAAARLSRGLPRERRATESVGRNRQRGGLYDSSGEQPGRENRTAVYEIETTSALAMVVVRCPSPEPG